jgi:hypothetical protein
MSPAMVRRAVGEAGGGPAVTVAARTREPRWR